MYRLLCAAAGLLLLCAPAQAGPVGPHYSQDEIRCAATVVMLESRNQPLDGQYKVMYVIMMRAAENRAEWGGANLCSVAKKANQFAADPTSQRWADAEYYRAVDIVAHVLRGGYFPPKQQMCMRYFQTVDNNSSWFKKRGLVAVSEVKDHRFYCEPESRLAYARN